MAGSAAAPRRAGSASGRARSGRMAPILASFRAAQYPAAQPSLRDSLPPSSTPRSQSIQMPW